MTLNDSAQYHVESGKEVAEQVGQDDHPETKGTISPREFYITSWGDSGTVKELMRISRA